MNASDKAVMSHRLLGARYWSCLSRFFLVTGYSLLLLIFFFFSSVISAEEAVIKFATLAPEGSTWMKVMQEWNKELMEKSGKRLRFKIYAGGVSGDEKDVIRKIRLGQLHAGGFTGVGLGEIAPEVRILDAPFLFESVEDVDYVYRSFEKEWENAFQKNGYVLLGWAEVGFVYFYTSKPIQNLSELKKIKMWMWEGDPIAEAAFKSLDVSPIPLSIADVMTSLQTGLIEGAYSSPLAIIALQWFTRTKYMYDFHLANACGAVLISKSFFDKIPKNLQTLLLATGKKHLDRLTQISRKENIEAIETLRKNGVKISSPPSEQMIEEYKIMGKNARKMLVGKLYPADFLNRVEKVLEEYRSSRKKLKS